jgi:bacterioferritin-associated ferredoxin
MYVCICNAVTDRQIREAARNGCCSLRELSAQTRCSTTCGKCARMAREILDAELRQRVNGGMPESPLQQPAA